MHADLDLRRRSWRLALLSTIRRRVAEPERRTCPAAVGCRRRRPTMSSGATSAGSGLSRRSRPGTRCSVVHQVIALPASSSGAGSSSVVPARTPHRVVDAVVGGQRPPLRRVAVLGVGDRGQGVAGDGAVHPAHVLAAGGRVLPERLAAASPPSPRCQRPDRQSRRALNRVYLALTEVTKAGKLEICAPVQHHQRRRRLLLAAGSPRSARSRRTAARPPGPPSRPGCSVASKNISRVSLQGSAPLNSGGPAFLAPLAGLRSHLAVLAIVTSFGLNWKSIAPSLLPVLLPPLARGRRRRASASPSPAWAGP